jgi:hypothetical protein
MKNSPGYFQERKAGIETTSQTPSMDNQNKNGSAVTYFFRSLLVSAGTFDGRSLRARNGGSMITAAVDGGS